MGTALASRPQTDRNPNVFRSRDKQGYVEEHMKQNIRIIRSVENRDPETNTAIHQDRVVTD